MNGIRSHHRSLNDGKKHLNHVHIIEDPQRITNPKVYRFATGGDDDEQPATAKRL
jgi:hypothetical protein